MKCLFLIACAAGAFVSSQAVAQADGARFTGPRAEARIGWDRPTVRAKATLDDDTISRSVGKTGVSYGGEAGYDHVAGNVVLGVYASYEGSTAKQCGELYGNDRACLRAGRNITAGARVGVPVDDLFMLYAKAGYSNGRATADYRDNTLQSRDEKYGQGFDGFHIGAGLELAVTRNLYSRIEYVHSSYGEESVTIEDLRLGAKPRRHQVVYGLGVRF